jgi:hypothetical protein
MVDRGRIELPTPNFQSVQDEEEPVVADPSLSPEGATEAHAVAEFANERQLDVL